MILNVTSVGRSVDEMDISDILPGQRTGPARWVYDPITRETTGLEIPHSAEPTAAQAEAIIRRLTTGSANEEIIRERAEQALAANQSDIVTNDAFLTIANPTTAQVTGQVKELTRQSSRQARELTALIRLVLRKLDATD